ncbi:MAG: hypothetical protein H7Y15_14675 [Pseudonocardia sp.]|nr:hypothetical protein [Pseudonocardia sp.]
MKMVSATPLGVSLTARVIAALPYAVGVLVAMSAVSFAIAGPQLGFGPGCDRWRCWCSAPCRSR